MADEFIKGLGILTTAGLIWFVVAAWFRTEGFGGTQLIAPVDEAELGTYTEPLVLLSDVMIVFAILGAITFWLVIPAVREGRRAYESRRTESE